MDRSICKKDFVLFLFPHRIYVFDICENRLIEAILTNIKRHILLEVLMQFSGIISPQRSPLE